MHWIKAANFDPLALLQHIGVVDYEDACQKVVQALLDADDLVLSEAGSLSDAEIGAYWDGIEKATVPVEKSTSSNFSLLMLPSSFKHFSHFI